MGDQGGKEDPKRAERRWERDEIQQQQRMSR